VSDERLDKLEARVTALEHLPSGLAQLVRRVRSLEGQRRVEQPDDEDAAREMAGLTDRELALRNARDLRRVLDLLGDL
jgi:hypothetical protein